MSLREKLICQVCSSCWVRKKARGRKPAVCPKCVKKQISCHQKIYIVDNNSKKLRKNSKKWVCPACNKSVIVFVNLEYPPVCRNTDVHSTKSIEMKSMAR